MNTPKTERSIVSKPAALSQRIVVFILIAVVVVRISAQTPHSIPDSTLEAAIRLELNKGEGPITVEDMERLTKIKISKEGVIDSLEGLQAARNLEWLELWDKLEVVTLKVPEDFSPLAGLPKLRMISISNNQLENIYLPDDLPALELLTIVQNQLKSIQLPENAPNLDAIFLYENQLPHLTVPGTYTNLSYINVSFNPLTTIQLPQNLPKIETINLMLTRLKYFKLHPFYRRLESLYLPIWVIEEAVIPRNTYHEDVEMYGVRELVRRGGKIVYGEYREIVTLYDPIKMNHDNSGLELKWEVGQLFSSPKPSGPWTPVEGATSPLRIDPNAPIQFYRVYPDDAIGG